MILVEETGLLSTVQDLGRPGLARLGVPPSGAADRYAHRLANRLVGNPESSATIEVTGGGLTILAEALAWVAVTGAQTELMIDDLRTGSHSSFPLRPGQRLTVRPSPLGLRNYVAVRGGIKITKTLGSRSTDLLTGLGPPALVRGQRLKLCRPRLPLPDIDLAPPNPPRRSLEISAGPRRDWFDEQAWVDLTTAEWTVSPTSNRVGIRLVGPTLSRVITDELPSEGIIRGAIQVPASGEPLIFLSDHPVTGGYPVIAVLTERAADHAAQLRPGDQFRLVSRTA